MEIKNNTQVGEIVRHNFKTAQLFEKNNIDFCCGGNITIEEACKKSNVKFEELVPELENVMLISDSNSKYIESLKLDELCDYIENRHHGYINETTPFLQQKLKKLCDVHGGNHTELFEIEKLFGQAVENLTLHMKNEELILFPAVRKLVRSDNSGEFKYNDKSERKELIDNLHQEHTVEGERFETISKLSDNYTVPGDACNTYRITFQTLKEFQEDLHIHIHTENNILFKKFLDY